MTGGRTASSRRLPFLVVLACVLGPAGNLAAAEGGDDARDGGVEQDAGSTSPAEEAQRRLAEGNRLFREARYDEALAAYRAAFALLPSAKLHFNIGLAEKMRGDAVRAAASFDLFLEQPGDADPEVQADAARYLAELSGIVSTVWTRSVVTGSSVFVDGVRVPDPGRQRPIRLAPGRHLLLVRGPDAASPWSRTLDLAPGASIAIAPEPVRPPLASAPAALRLVAPAGPPSGAARPVYRRWWFWAAAGVTLLGVGLVTALALHDGCREEDGCYRLTKAPGMMSP